MHIPDGMLSPSTTAVITVAMLPVWTLAARKVRASLGMRQIPMLSLGAAFCFTVMMFNIPALGGTTAHPVGGTLLAVMFGPWAAVIGISVALAIQALFFGDGGLLTLGANCFTMAFALPFVGYSVYRLISHRLPQASAGRALAAGMGAYIAVNVAAALVAILLGIQPALFHEPNGHALYFPFGLSVTLPAMLATHLLIAGPAEAIVTFLVVRYLLTEREAGIGVEMSFAAANAVETHIGAQQLSGSPPPRSARLLVGLLTLLALTPLGLLAKGDAWGEWDAAGVAAQIQKRQGVGYVPAGIERAEANGYKGVRGLQDYASNEGTNKLGYMGAGLLGVGTIVGLLMLGGRLLLSSPNGSRTLTLRKIATVERGATVAGSSANGSVDNDDGAVPAETDTPAHAPMPAELPVWLRTSSNLVTESSDVELGRQNKSGNPSNPFIARTLAELAHNLRVTLEVQAEARQPGYLQKLDPRAKVLGFLGLILLVSLMHNLGTLALLYGLALLLAALSKLALLPLLRRVWLSVPLFVGALALPATLNLVTPGRTLLALWHHPDIAITVPGLTLAATLLLRVGVAVTLAALLTLSTPWNDLLRALRVIHVPRLFVSVLAMTYRYLAVLMQSADDLFVARRSRTVGRTTNASGRHFVGASIGALFGKTVSLSEEIHNAMLSRGFTGDMHTLSRFRWQLRDSLWIIATLLTACLSIASEHTH